MRWANMSPMQKYWCIRKGRRKKVPNEFEKVLHVARLCIGGPRFATEVAVPKHVRWFKDNGKGTKLQPLDIFDNDGCYVLVGHVLVWSGLLAHDTTGMMTDRSPSI